MTEKQKHPAISCIDEKIRVATQKATYYKMLNDPQMFERMQQDAENRISEAKKALDQLHRQREFATTEMARLQAEVDSWTRAREAALSNDKIAQALWLKLLVDRKSGQQ